MLETSSVQPPPGTRPNPKGPKTMPMRIYATIIACRKYKKVVARTAAPENIRNIEKIIVCSFITSKPYRLLKTSSILSELIFIEVPNSGAKRAMRHSSKILWTCLTTSRLSLLSRRNF